MASAKATTNHDEIRRWVEARGGHPAHVKTRANRRSPVVLRIDYLGFNGQETRERIESDEWFDAALEIGFRTSIEREWNWRVKRGESTANLRAFARFADPERNPPDQGGPDGRPPQRAQ